jgi:hypothetical protein
VPWVTLIPGRARGALGGRIDKGHGVIHYADLGIAWIMRTCRLYRWQQNGPDTQKRPNAQDPQMSKLPEGVPRHILKT